MAFKGFLLITFNSFEKEKIFFFCEPRDYTGRTQRVGKMKNKIFNFKAKQGITGIIPSRNSEYEEY